MSTENAENESILQTLAGSFTDVPDFDRLLRPRLLLALQATDEISIRKRKAAKPYYSAHEYAALLRSDLFPTVELAFECAHVLVLYRRPEYHPLLWTDVDQLLRHYPSFTDLPFVELGYLLKYRNAVRVALTVFPARRNKARIMAIAARLEGSHKLYITGTGQSNEVTRRVQIYEQEGGIQMERRFRNDSLSKVQQYGTGTTAGSAGKRRRSDSDDSSSTFEATQPKRSRTIAGDDEHRKWPTSRVELQQALETGKGDIPKLPNASSVGIHSNYFSFSGHCAHRLDLLTEFTENSAINACLESSLGTWSDLIPFEDMERSLLGAFE